MNTVAESRGMTYSAEAAGNGGNVRCHVVRRHAPRDRRAHYTIFVSNETTADAQALAFVPETAAARYRTVAQMAAGPGSDFSTTTVLDVSPSGFLPELRVAVTTGEVEFTLAVPSLQLDDTAFDADADDDVLVAGVTAPTEAQSASQPPPRSQQRPQPAAQRPQPPAVREAYAAPIQPFVAPVRHTEAEPRHSRRAARPRAPMVTPILIMFAGYVLIAAFLIARPRIADFALPATATQQSSVPVLYHASGLGSADYTVLGPDAQPIAGGPLVMGAGSFTFTAPKDTAAQAYLVRLRVSNIFGSAIAEDYLHVPAPPATPAPPAPRPRHVAPALPPPQIRSLALDRATVASGDTLNVYYDIAATSGTIALLDPSAQITYGKSQLDMSGHASFIAPRTDIPRSLTVVVTAQRGKATTESRTGVSLTPFPAPVPQSNPADPSGLGLTGVAGAPAAPGQPSAVTISAPASVRSQQPIRVDVAGAAVGLQLVLLDGSGNELDKRELPPGQSSTVFRAPAVSARSQFLFEATSARGTGSETVVRPIVVLP
ncbi:MAG: hypothetical protein ABSB70_08695 [Candidatus Velthaea sp.]